MTEERQGRDRLMVAVSPAPQAVELVRAAARMRRDRPWIAVSVEPVSRELASAEARRVASALSLAERLGAETLVVRGDSVPDALLSVARARGVTRLVVGRPTHAPVRDRLRGSMLDTLLRNAGGIEVLVTGAEAAPAPTARPRPDEPSGWQEYAYALGFVALAALLGRVFGGALDVVDQALIHLLAVVLAASRLSRKPALFASLAAVASFDLFFVPPYLTFRVSELRFVTSFLVMTVVGILVSALTLRVREQAEASRRREQRTAALYAITRAFAAGPERAAIARATAEHSAALVGGDAEVWLVGPDGLWRESSGPSSITLEPAEEAVARWVLEHDRPAGRGTEEQEGSASTWLPIPGEQGLFGALGVRAAAPMDPEQRQLLDLFAAAAGSALERARLAEDAARAAVHAEAEAARSGLLSTVSHDLRTPLASIVGGVSAVIERGGLPSSDAAILETARDEAMRLGRLVQDLLDLTRLRHGVVAPRLEWWPASELVSGVRGRLSGRLAGRVLRVEIAPPELELRADGLLVGQLLENLIDNAVKFSPEGSPVELSITDAGDAVRVEVRDHGRGLPPGEEARIFERFYRGKDGGRAPGAGLGLAICAAVAHVHGGRIWVEPREDGPGARFIALFPTEGAPPGVAEELA